MRDFGICASLYEIVKALARVGGGGGFEGRGLQGVGPYPELALTLSPGELPDF